MENPIENVTEWARSTQAKLTDHLFQLGLRMQAWMVLGNAAALVLLFNAAITGKVEGDAVISSAKSFFAGLVLAFLSAVVGYCGSLLGLHIVGETANSLTSVAVNEYYIEKLKSEGVEIRDGNPFDAEISSANDKLKSLQNKRKIMLLISVPAIALYLSSAVAFGVGVLRPLKSGLRVVGSEAEVSILNPRPFSARR